uniref:Uncharacterized protein n=1 Tax=Caenorhabditis japonica TaxID=281687 RepID=A0A8R1DZ21_CAEJA
MSDCVVFCEPSTDTIHRSKLTVRYQLAENVKALRTFVPFVVIDNCISISYVFSMIFFQVDFNFDLEIHNVLGMNIAGTQADYFSQLKIQWLT